MTTPADALESFTGPTPRFFLVELLATNPSLEGAGDAGLRSPQEVFDYLRSQGIEVHSVADRDGKNRWPSEPVAATQTAADRAANLQRALEQEFPGITVHPAFPGLQPLTTEPTEPTQPRTEKDWLRDFVATPEPEPTEEWKTLPLRELERLLGGRVQIDIDREGLSLSPEAMSSFQNLVWVVTLANLPPARQAVTVLPAAHIKADTHPNIWVKNHELRNWFGEETAVNKKGLVVPDLDKRGRLATLAQKGGSEYTPPDASEYILIGWPLLRQWFNAEFVFQAPDGDGLIISGEGWAKDIVEFMRKECATTPEEVTLTFSQIGAALKATNLRSAPEGLLLTPGKETQAQIDTLGRFTLGPVPLHPSEVDGSMLIPWDELRCLLGAIALRPTPEGITFTPGPETGWTLVYWRDTGTATISPA